MYKNRLILSIQKVSFKRYFLLIVLVINQIQTAYTQVNYVLNPSFEDYSRCPYDWDQIKFANYWAPIDLSNHPAEADTFGSPYCSPEYCNTCAPIGSKVAVPNGSFYSHFPRNGNGMAEVMTFSDENAVPYPLSLYRRDYLNGHLYKPLTAGKTYCVSFYVTLEQASQYAINHIGAYLDDGTIDSSTGNYCGQPHINDTPQVFTIDVINDTSNWVKIEGNFIATGRENAITIGNFSDKSHTIYDSSISKGATGNTWYLIDDVCVVESDIPAYAGGDRYVGLGDSTFIGRNELVNGCVWYANGTLIDTMHAGLWVKPTVTTTYKVEQTICGITKIDSVKVTVYSEEVNSISKLGGFIIYPNPARNEISIHQENNTLSEAQVTISDVVGRQVLSTAVTFNRGNAKLPLALAKGVYLLRINNGNEIVHTERLVID